MASSATSTAPAQPTFSPALQPPPGIESNPQNPDSLRYLSDVAVGICIPFITIFFFARCFVRLYVKRTWTAEDWLASVAWAGTVAYCGIMTATMRNSGGEHMWDLTVAQAQQAAYWFNVASIEYGIMICVTKLAVLALYRRVFSTRRFSLFDNIILGLVVILLGFYVSTSFVKIFECTPRAKIVNSKLPGTCINVSMLLNTSGLFNTITDFIILLLPFHAVYKLKMSVRKKLLVVCVFTFGLCAPVFSTIGFVVRLRISGNPDTTWNQPEILLWGAAELTTGNLCVCFPELGTLFNRKSMAQRRRTGPTASILQGSASNRQRSRKTREMDGDYMKSSLVGNFSYGNVEDLGIPMDDRATHVEEITPAYLR